MQLNFDAFYSIIKQNI